MTPTIDINESARKLQEEVDKAGNCFVIGHSDTELFVYSTVKGKSVNITEFDGFPVVEKTMGKVSA